MIYVGLHAFDLILEKQWADLKPLLEQLIYPLKGFKFNLSSDPKYYLDPKQKDLFQCIEVLRPKYSRVSCAIPIKNPDGTFIDNIDDASRMLDVCLDIMQREPSWWLINEPYNYSDKNGKITYEQIKKIIGLIQFALFKKGLTCKKLYLGDCPDEWQEKGWYELKNAYKELYPKCVHYGTTFPLEKGINPSIKMGRLLRSGCKAVCDECGVYDYETKPEYENFRAWENPAHNWKRAVTAIAGSVFNDFCWWPLFFHTNNVGQSVGIMTNTVDKKTPRIHPVLKYFLKPPYGIGNG